jgi:copper oxidase (laccase) domain-containing protein
VAENRARVAEMLGVEAKGLLTLFQKHSAEAVVADKPWKAPPEADAIVTSKPGLAIGILTADCAPVLFCDAKAGVIGAAHAGWRGALSGIVEATVEAMEKLGRA